MNLCIDQGNSSTKVGVFEKNVLIEYFSFPVFGTNEIDKLLSTFNIDKAILSSVVLNNELIISEITKCVSFFLELTHETSIPVKNQYKTPETLGKDRLAAVVGAAFIKPNSDILVVDSGTAITFDFIDSNKIYFGGNISPGINLRLKALHQFTQKLPLVEVQGKKESPLLGNDTESALISGALQGVVFEIDGYIDALKIKYPQLSTFLTGGSTFYFDTKLKNAIFAERNLVLIGLNQILQYNV